MFSRSAPGTTPRMSVPDTMIATVKAIDAAASSSRARIRYGAATRANNQASNGRTT